MKQVLILTILIATLLASGIAASTTVIATDIAVRGSGGLFGETNFGSVGDYYSGNGEQIYGRLITANNDQLSFVSSYNLNDKLNSGKYKIYGNDGNGTSQYVTFKSLGQFNATNVITIGSSSLASSTSLKLVGEDSKFDFDMSGSGVGKIIISGPGYKGHAEEWTRDYIFASGEGETFNYTNVISVSNTVI